MAKEDDKVCENDKVIIKVKVNEIDKIMQDKLVMVKIFEI